MTTGLNPQRIRSQLSPGSFYWFHHTSKGRILAKLLSVAPTDESDEVDEVLLQVAIPCSPGSQQERIAVAFYYNSDGAKRPVPVRVMGLRPSKITQTEVPTQADIDAMDASFDEYEAMKSRPALMPGAMHIRRHGAPQPPVDQEVPLGPLPTLEVQRRGKFKTLLRRAMRRKD